MPLESGSQLYPSIVFIVRAFELSSVSPFGNAPCYVAPPKTTKLDSPFGILFKIPTPGAFVSPSDHVPTVQGYPLVFHKTAPLMAQ